MQRSPERGKRTRLLTYYIIGLILAVCIGMTPLKFVSFLIIAYLLARLLPVPFGLISKLVLSFICLSAAVCAVAGVAWVLGKPLSSGIILFILSACLGVVCFVLRGNLPQLFPARSDILNLDDLVSLLLAVLAAIILLSPLGPRSTAAQLAPLVATGGDNSSHIKLIKLDDMNRGYSIGLSNRVASDLNLRSYPQGWHMVTAFTKWLIEPTVSIDTSATRLLYFFYLSCVFWFAMLVYLAVRLALWVGDNSKDKLAKVAPVLVVAIAAGGWLLPLVVNGFQTQIAALVLLLGELVFIILAAQTKKATSYALFLLALLMIVGINFVWIFLAPVAIGVWAVAAMCIWLRNRTWPPLWFILSALSLGAVGAIQFLVQIGFSVPSSDGVSFINSRGFIPQIAMYPLIVIMAMCSLFAYLMYKNVKIRVSYLFASIALLFSLVLMAYQLNTIKELRYYYFKSTYTFILLSLPLLGSMAYRLMDSLLTLQSPFKRLPSVLHRSFLFTVVVFVGCTAFWSLKSTAFDGLIHKRLQGISQAQAETLDTLLSADRANGYLFVPIGSCNRGDDIRASLFSKALAYALPTDVKMEANFQYSLLSKEELFREIHDFLAVYREKIYIVSSDHRITQELSASLGDQMKYVRMFDIDSSPESETAVQCPDRIRTLTLEEIERGLQ